MQPCAMPLMTICNACTGLLVAAALPVWRRRVILASPSKQLLCSEHGCDPPCVLTRKTATTTGAAISSAPRRSCSVEKGFEGTTIRDIAGAVGMRSGSPFYHFASKHELLIAVMEEGLAARPRAHARGRRRAGADGGRALSPSRPRALRHPARDRQRLHPGDALRLALAAGAASASHRRAEGPLRRDLAGDARRRCTPKAGSAPTRASPA